MQNQIMKTIETPIGKMYMLPPERIETEEDTIRLHILIARLLVKDYIEQHKDTQ